MTTTESKRTLKLGDTIRIKDQKRLGKVTGFFTNIPNPEDPECTVHIFDFTIDQYPNLMIAERTPDPNIYDSIEVVFDGGFAGIEIEMDQVEERIDTEDSWTTENQTFTKKNRSKSIIIERSNRKVH